MSDDAPAPRRLSTTSVGCLLFGGLVLYILAPGPLGIIAHFTGSDWFESTFQIAFYPLIFLHGRFPLVASLYEAYFDWLSNLCGLT
jgi:hypothetical protein